MSELSDRALLALQRQEVSIAIWGCGHIGASAMYYFSRKGIRCIGYDIAHGRVEEIRQGRFLSTDTVPIDRIQDGQVPVSATTRWTEVRDHAPLIHVLAVPTERGAEPSSANLQDIMPQVCDTIRSTDLGDLVPLVSIESTIQPSWIDTVVLPELQANGLEPGRDVLVAAAPRRDWFSGQEHTLETLPRVVGGSSAEAADLASQLYGLVCGTIIPARDAHHAAFTKVIENLIRFQSLALANSLSLAFPDYDMTHVLSLASTKWNIPLFHPSMGIGGHCIPLAPQYTLAEGGYDNRYLAPVRDAADFNAGYFSKLYAERLRSLLADCRSIAILGLAYTADAKMHKLSPALDAVECLKSTPRLRLHDPYYTADDIDDICGVATLTFPEDLAQCDGIVLVTGHTPYLETPVEQFVQPGTVIVDNFGYWQDRNFASGVRYLEVGRPEGADSRPIFTRAQSSSTSSA